MENSAVKPYNPTMYGRIGSRIFCNNPVSMLIAIYLHLFDSVDVQKKCTTKKKPFVFAAKTSSVTFQKSIGLLTGVSLIIGSIIGTGIFVTPKGILMNTGSVGVSLLVWGFSGIISILGALVYMELGTTFPKSGGDFTYLRIFYGDFVAFLFLWSSVLVLVPVTKAISALIFANYVLSPLFPTCPAPPLAIRLIAALVICFLTYINCRNVQWVTRVQNIFTISKVIALITIIISGMYHLCKGNSMNFIDTFQGTRTEPGYIALSFYSGLYTYSGWSSLNLVTEELKAPSKNLPRAICLSLPLVTLIYILTNVAYFAVLSPEEILASNAVAVTFGNKILGVMSWIIPLFVALSTFGSLNGGIFLSARIFFVGAREGHLPNFLSMISLNYLTPTPSLIFMGALSLMYLLTTEVYVLINYTAFVDAFFLTLCVAGMLWLRYKKPDLERPIKVNILIPITFLLVCIFLITLPFYVSPWESGMGIAIIITGIPVYYMTVFWKEKPILYKKGIGKVAEVVQKMLLSVKEEKSD